MKSSDLTLGGIPFGTVYLIDPELSAAERRRDLENIKSLQFDTVVLWPVVSRWEGETVGEIAFDSIDAVMSDCADLGLQAILELQGQNPSYQESPPCVALPKGCPRPDPRDIPINDSVYRERTREYFHAVGNHFKGHPALRAYCLFNEVGNDSRDEPTIAAFVDFLKAQYAGDVKKMNNAWGTFFSDFEGVKHVPANYRAWEWSSCVAERDWQRFRSQNYADNLELWKSWMREVDDDVVLFADILQVDTIQNRAANYYGIVDTQVAERMDVLGLSCYANFLAERWWECDFWKWALWWRTAESEAHGKQTFVTEMMTQNRTMFPLEYSSMTDQIRLWSYQAIFHGIKGLIYWKYRPFRKGRQVSGRGLTDFDGVPNHFGADASEVARFTKENEERLAGAKPDYASCAILHDPNTQNIYYSLQPERETFYNDAINGLFHACWRHGIAPQIIQPKDLREAVLSGCKVILIPCNVSISQESADLIKAFVEQGGVLFTESRFGLLDEEGTLWNHVPGGDLHETLGFEEKLMNANTVDQIQLRDGSQLTLDLECMQTVEIASETESLLSTEKESPVLLAKKVGQGLAIHTTIQLGHQLFKEEPGAFSIFDLAFEKIAPFVEPVVKIEAKPFKTDVSILLDETEKPLLAGITNYEETEATVVLNHAEEPVEMGGDSGARTVLREGKLIVTVPARSGVAVWFA